MEGLGLRKWHWILISQKIRSFVLGEVKNFTSNKIPSEIRL